MGIVVGMTQETVIDDKGRIVISKEVRDALGLKKGMALKLHAESNRIILEKAVAPEELIENMKGFVKKGSKVPVSDPLDLKNIWK